MSGKVGALWASAEEWIVAGIAVLALPWLTFAFTSLSVTGGKR